MAYHTVDLQINLKSLADVVELGEVGKIQTAMDHVSLALCADHLEEADICSVSQDHDEIVDVGIWRKRSLYSEQPLWK